MSEKVEVVQKNGKKKNEKGATLVEYALLVAVIAVGAIVAMQLLRNGVSSSFSATVSQMNTTG
jgi:Flp pilus assembly pilin Flp